MDEDDQFPARAPIAVAAGPDADALRTAYLDVLKLCLCDLGGASTTSVWRHGDCTVRSRELTGEELAIRAAGFDWPLHGLTMVGLRRLDDLQSCVEQVVREGVEGDLIEAGTWRGGAAILMRATLDALGDTDRTVWVADSFEGLPVPEGNDPDAERLAAVDFLAVPLEDVKANFARFGCERGVRFVPGFFEETMPGLADRRWSVVRLDGDSYDATWAALQSLYPGLSVGGQLIVDDYGALDACRRAVDEFRDRHGIDEPLEKVDFTCVRWRRASGAPVEPEDMPARRRTSNGSVRAPDREPTRVWSAHALELDRRRRVLDRELADLRDRLAAAEAEIAALQGSPLRGPKAWMAHKLRSLRP